jgi:hypothetical protein
MAQSDHFSELSEFFISTLFHTHHNQLAFWIPTTGLSLKKKIHMILAEKHLPPTLG